MIFLCMKKTKKSPRKQAAEPKINLVTPHSDDIPFIKELRIQKSTYISLMDTGIPEYFIAAFLYNKAFWKERARVLEPDARALLFIYTLRREFTVKDLKSFTAEQQGRESCLRLHSKGLLTCVNSDGIRQTGHRIDLKIVNQYKISPEGIGMVLEFLAFIKKAGMEPANFGMLEIIKDEKKFRDWLYG